MESSMVSTTIESDSGSVTNGAARLVEQVKEQASRLTDLGVAKVAELAEARKEAAAQKLDAVGGVVRHFAVAADQSFGDVAGAAVHRGGDVVASVAQTLRRTSVADMADGTRSIIARYPAIAIAAASVVGFAAGRIAKAGLGQAPGGQHRYGLENGKGVAA
jgi:hypothetical protein